MEDEYLKFIEFYLEFTGKHYPVTYHEFTNIFSNESKLVPVFKQVSGNLVVVARFSRNLINEGKLNLFIKASKFKIEIKIDVPFTEVNTKSKLKELVVNNINKFCHGN